MSVKVYYKGSTIADITGSATKTLTTGGKLCADNITLENTESGGGEELDGFIARTLTSFNGSQSMIGSFAFCGCSLLTAVSFPNCLQIMDSAFYSCNNLSSLAFPKCSFIGTSAFALNSKIKNASFPECTIVGSSAFARCGVLESISFPKCSLIYKNAFFSCSYLTEISFPQCANIWSSAFASCSRIVSAYFPKCSNLQMSAFMDCTKLKEITIGTEISIVCSMGNSGAFLRCSALTSIYVPASLLATYQSARYWSYYADKLVGV